MTEDESRLKRLEDTKKKWRRIGIEWWADKDPKVRAYYQLQEHILILDFSDFHGAAEKLLGRPVWTHEFADPEALLTELETGNKIGMADILGKLAKYKKPIIAIVHDSKSKPQGSSGATEPKPHPEAVTT